MKLEADNQGRVSAIGTCPYCGALAHLRHVAQVGMGDTFKTTNFLVCSGCMGGITMQVSHTGSGPKLIGYSPRMHRRFGDPQFIPKELMSVLDQVYSAEAEAAWTLAALGCRLVMERLVFLHDVKEGSLAEKLAQMTERFPPLAGPLANADLVRLIGNSAAHDMQTDFSQAEAEAAIEFTEEVLRDVYVLPRKWALAKARLDKK